MEFNEKLKGVENLAEETNRYLFLQCFNNIEFALNGAREASVINPSERNILIQEQLEEFAEINKEYYQEAKKYFEEMITKQYM